LIILVQRKQGINPDFSVGIMMKVKKAIKGISLQKKSLCSEVKIRLTNQIKVEIFEINSHEKYLQRNSS
jgi:hypothetical protein